MEKLMILKKWLNQSKIKINSKKITMTKLIIGQLTISK
jgi:hypothetical protein